MATKDITVRLRLRSQQFARSLRTQSTNLRGFGAVAQRITSRAGRAAGELMDKLANPGAIAGSIGVGLVARELVDFEDLLDAIRVNASASAGEIEQLKDRITELAGAEGTHQGLDELARAAEVLIAKDSALLGQLTTTNLLERIGVAATATGASIEDVAETAYQLHQALQLPWEEVGAGLDTLAVLGKDGAFELRDMAQHLPTVAAEMERIGQTGARGLSRTAALLQIVRRGTADASSAANNLVNLISYLQSPTGSRRLQQEGIRVFDVDGSMRDLFVILGELHEATNGGRNAELVGSLFSDRQARTGVASLLKDFGTLQEMAAKGASAGSVLDADAAVRVQNLKGALKDLKTEFLKLADVHGMPALEKLTELVRWLAEHPKVLENALKVGAGVVGVAMLRKVGKGAWDLFSGGPGKAVQGALGGGGQRVFVTNWPGGLGGMSDLAQAARGAGRLAGGTGAATAGGFGGTVAGASAGTIAGAVAIGGAVGVGIGSAVNHWVLPEDFKTTMQDVMATAFAPFNEAAARLAAQNTSDRLANYTARLRIELDKDSLLREVSRDG